MSFLQDLALAHRKHEGWYPGSVSQRNNNPGNLRLTAYQARVYGATKGERNFARFPTYAAGFAALTDDLRAKLTGYSAHINYSKNPTFLDYVKVYAPKDDGNNPSSYAQALLNDLQRYGIRLDTPLSTLAGLIQGPQEPVMNLSPAERYDALIRRAARATEAGRRIILSAAKALARRMGL